MDQQLRLGATFQDGATPAIRKLKAEMAGVKVMPGMTAANEWMAKFTTSTTDFVRSGANVSDIFSSMGIAGLTASASLASLVGHYKALSEHVLTIKELGREVGLTTNQLNQFAEAGQKFGVGAEAIEGAVDAFKSQMPQFMRGFGNLFDELAQRAPNLVKTLKLEDTEHQIKTILGYLGQAQLQANPQQQKQMAELFFPGHGADIEKLFAKGPKAYAEEVERMAQTLPSITKEMEEQAEKLRDATGDFNRAIEGFELKAGPGVLGTMTAIVKEMQEFVDALEHSKDSKGNVGASIANSITNPTWAEKGLSQGWSWLSGDTKKAWSWLNGHGGANDQGAHGLSLLHRSSYGGDDADRPKLWKASYDGGDGFGGTPAAGSASDMLTEGVKQGVLAAFREWQAQLSVDGSSGGGGGGGGFTPASFGAGAGGRGWRGFGAGGAGGGYGGAAGVGRWWTKDNIEHGIDRLMKEAHLSRAGAEGLVSRWASVEAPGGPGSVNPKSGAYGIAQWLGARKNGAGGDYDSQLSHAIAELNGSEKAAGDALRAAHNAHEGAIGASMFERAEGYNPRTGTDTWTAKSEAGNQHLGIMLRGGAINPDGELTPGGGLPGEAVDRAQKLIGMGSAQAAQALGAQMTPHEWCADFVNGVFAKAHIKGSNSSLANSFLNWGADVAAAAIRKGDVLVRRDGSHVGMAEGGLEMHNGRRMVHMLSGNYSHKVSESWEDPNGLFARRAAPAHLPDINAPPASPNGSGGGSKHHLDIHLHPDGNIRSARLRSRGDGLTVKMRRWDTMTEPSLDA